MPNQNPNFPPRVVAPSRPYSFAQFHAKTGANMGAYSRYLTYMKNAQSPQQALGTWRQHAVTYARNQRAGLAGGGGIPAGAAAAAEAGGLAPEPFSQFQQQSKAYIGSVINPQLALIRGQYNQDVARNSKAINLAGAGQQSAAQSAFDQIKNVYAGQQSFAQALGQATGAGLGAEGVGSRAVGQANTGSGIAVGQGANAAAAQMGYMGTLPYNARLAAGYNLKQTLGNLNANRLKQTQALQAQVPQLAQQLYQHYLDQELNKGVANLGLGKTALTTGAAATRQQTALGAPDYSGSKTVGSPVVLTKGGAVFHDPSGRAIPIRVKPGQSSSKLNVALGRAQTAMNASSGRWLTGGSKKVVSKAGTPGIGAIPGTPPTYKTVKAKTNYFKAINIVSASVYGILHPYMSDLAIRELAQQYINAYYAPGELGRPGTGVGGKQPPGYHGKH